MTQVHTRDNVFFTISNLKYSFVKKNLKKSRKFGEGDGYKKKAWKVGGGKESQKKRESQKKK
jgi:hypothetical protein